MTEQSRGPTRGARSGLTGIAVALLALFVTASPATLSGQTIDEFSIPTSDSGVWGITAGPDGALWFTEFNGNKIGRITTDGVVAEFTVPTAGSGPTGIAAGPDGELWFTESDGNKIGRITTDGVITEFTVPTFSSGPVGIAAGPDGALWFTEHGGKIGRISVELPLILRAPIKRVPARGPARSR